MAAVVVPVLFLLLVGVCGGLVVLYLRHRRLQHNFTAFANSHYNSRLGSAIFSSGDELGKTSMSPAFHEICILLQCTSEKCHLLFRLVQLASLQFTTLHFNSVLLSCFSVYLCLDQLTILFQFVLAQ